MNKFFLIITCLFIFKCFSLSIARTESKAEIEALELINNHLKEPELKSNVALQQLIKDIGYYAKEFYSDQKVNDEVIQQARDEVLKNIKKENYIGLPFALKDIKGFNKFVSILVKRYRKNLSQIIKSFESKIKNTQDQNCVLDDLVKDKIHSYLFDNDICELLTVTLKLNPITTSTNFAISPCGEHIAIFSNKSFSGKLEMIDIQMQKVIRELKFCILDFTPNDGLKKMSFSPCGRFIAFKPIMLFRNKNIQVLDLQSGKFCKEFNDVNYSSFAFSPCGKFIALGSYDHKVYIIDLTTNQIVKTIQNDDKVESVEFSPCGKYLATGILKAAKIFDIESGNVILLVPYKYYVGMVKFSPCGKYLASSDYDSAKIIDIQNKELIKEIKPNEGLIEDISFDPLGKYLLACSGILKGMIQIVDLKNKENTNFKFDWPEKIGFTHSGKIFIAGICISGSKRYRYVKMFPFFNNLNIKQIKLLSELAQTKQCAKNIVIELNKEDQDIFNSLPDDIKLILKQKLKFIESKITDNTKKEIPENNIQGQQISNDILQEKPIESIVDQSASKSCCIIV